MADVVDITHVLPAKQSICIFGIRQHTPYYIAEQTHMQPMAWVRTLENKFNCNGVTFIQMLRRFICSQLWNFQIRQLIRKYETRNGKGIQPIIRSWTKIEIELKFFWSVPLLKRYTRWTLLVLWWCRAALDCDSGKVVETVLSVFVP